jgi:nicotinamidase-related amidase
MTWNGPRTVVVELTLPTPVQIELDPRRAALVIVDMQRQFLDDTANDVLRQYGMTNERLVGAVDGNVTLLAKARDAGAKVIFVQSVRSPDALEFTVFHQPPYLLEGTPAVEIIDELAPLPTESVVQKRSHDPFCHSRLEGLLDDEGITPGDWTILVTGVSSDTCARSAVLGFSHRKYRVLVPMDCTASATAEDEAMAFAQYTRRGYSFNIGFTLSSLVHFTAPVDGRAGAVPTAN